MGAPGGLAATQPELDQDRTLYNYSAQRGVPISSVIGAPPGSDGRGPTPVQQGSETIVPASPGQFQSLVGFSAGVPRTNWNAAASYLANAEATDLPRGKNNGAVSVVMPAASVGLPFIAQRATLLFGSVIPVPDVDVDTNLLVGITKESYWLPEPYTTNRHTNAPYYYSPHAKRVFAIQPGPVTIIWKRAVSTLTPPSVPYSVENGNYYALLERRYVVSGSPVKRPQKLFWTEGAFSTTGKMITVGVGKATVHFVYNAAFPEFVDQEYQPIGHQPIVPPGTNTFQSLRTVWFDGRLIRANNVEGRIFMELLGDDRTDGQSKNFLGFEIVDVTRQPHPQDITIKLGERITAFQDTSKDDSLLTPEPVTSGGGVNGVPFTYSSQLGGSGRPVLHAVRATANLNDYQIFWMVRGEQGLLWPEFLARYALVWPSDPAEYSHYVRPSVNTEAEAAATAVALPQLLQPTLEDQDLDAQGALRGKLTQQAGYYSFLDPSLPAHRALLRYAVDGQVHFERVFSWLDQALLSTNFVGSVATTLGTWTTNGNTFLPSPARSMPSVFRQTAYVGDRLLPPAGESGSGPGEGYWAGHVVAGRGQSYDPTAYVDPLVAGFEAASRGAIIPVNAIPGTNQLEVLWLRRAPVSVNRGFSPIYWPSVVGTYTLAWPETASEIVLASNEGSGPLDSLQARGQIYVQNGGGAVGYNPNEEHALILGGQVYALRDDLNLTGEGGYSSDPFVLLRYTSSDGRPAMRPFRVRREAPERGVLFDYVTEAGHPLQAPMPLPLLAPPVVAGVNASRPSPTLAANPPQGWTAADSDGDNRHYARFTVEDRKNNLWVYRGLHQEPELQAGTYLPGSDTFASSLNATAVAGLPFNFTLHSSQRGSSLRLLSLTALPAWLTLTRDVVYTNAYGARATNGQSLTLAGTPPLDATPGTADIALVVSNQVTGAVVTNQMALRTMGGGLKPAIRLGDDVSSWLQTLQTIGLEPGAFPTDEITVEFFVKSDSTSDRTFFQLRPEFADRRMSASLQEGVVKWEFGFSLLPGDPFAPPTPPRGFLAYSPPSGQPIQAGIWEHWAFVSSKSGDFMAIFRNGTEVSRMPGAASLGMDESAPRYLVVGPAMNGSLADFRVWRTARSATEIDTYRYATLSGNEPGLAVHYTFAKPPGFPANLEPPPIEQDRAPADGVLMAGLGSSVRRTIFDERRQQFPLELTYPSSFAGTNVTYVDRPPFLARSPDAGNSFAMHFYYRTLPGFAWPGLNAPPDGTVVPYLRPRAGAGGGYVGSGSSATDPALDIVYRPVWPDRDPTNPAQPLPRLGFGSTATQPNGGLPAVRGQSSLRVLYQQSVATRSSRAFTANLSNHVSVVLFDPTRIKTSPPLSLPAGVRREVYQDKVHFPGLPPHLATRLHFRQEAGSPSAPGAGRGQLILEGRFQDGSAGEPYLDLNVLAGADLAAVMALCPGSDPNYAAWVAAIQGLSTALQTFTEQPAGSGRFAPDPGRTVQHAVSSLPEVHSDETAVDSYALSAVGPGSGYVTLMAGNGRAFTPAVDPVALYIFRVTGPLNDGELKVLPSDNPLSELVSFQHTPDVAGREGEYEYQWMMAPPSDGRPLPVTNEVSGIAGMLTLGWQPVPAGTNRVFTLGGSGIEVLADNYLTLRYRAVNAAHPVRHRWSAWTTPGLAEGWIKRVVAGINPFNQRTSDLFNNRVNTDVSLLTQAGRRWEGNVALNSGNLNQYGLIEIYETVLNRGRGLSINAAPPINYGPANDALLLAAGYVHDLYMMLGDEARADADNPTIGIGTKDRTYGDVATALFSFQGQVPNLLEEELALLRGRSDFLQPSIHTAPFYNRLVWNYTRGIHSGEVVYGLNYNILDQTTDGVVNAADAAVLYPQGHGDAYGHYLTALTGFYSLLVDEHFDWVPKTEAVNVLGVPVQVGYQHERKFAAAAAAVARTGKQVADLTWRLGYRDPMSQGWEGLSTTNRNERTGRTEYWAMDHWAARTGGGAYLNWLVGNAILPDVDDDPAHVGILKIDRTTVLELEELALVGADLQAALDNADGRTTPLGLPTTAVPFDLNPNAVVGGENGTHFEQIVQRAKTALNNAVAAFDDAKDVTRLMRSEQDSLAETIAAIERQELAYTNALVEVYGSPYPDDIGVGRTFVPGYAGPDFVHYSYIDQTALPTGGWQGGLYDAGSARTYNLALRAFPSWWSGAVNYRFQQAGTNGPTGVPYDFRDGPAKDQFDPAAVQGESVLHIAANAYQSLNQIRTGPGFADTAADATNRTVIQFHYEGTGFRKPSGWMSRRQTPGRAQEAAAAIVQRQGLLFEALEAAKRNELELDTAVRDAIFKVQAESDGLVLESNRLANQRAIQTAAGVAESVHFLTETLRGYAHATYFTFLASTPNSMIFGTANGGDVIKPPLDATMTALLFGALTALSVTDGAAAVASKITKAVFGRRNEDIDLSLDQSRAADRISDHVLALQPLIEKNQQAVHTINARLHDLDDARRRFESVLGSGRRILLERESFRKRSAAVIQGYRSRDAAFRLFRDEKLDRYKALFDLAARYAFMAAQAYDYETGLLGTSQGRKFINRIVQARALGVVRNGEPQFAGSNTGDPGLSSALAEMLADWQVVKGRLGFNNPDAYGTTVSLRAEHFRILPGIDGDANWTDVLHRARMANILDDPDVRRFCLQVDQGHGLPVPGLVLSFATTIAEGRNLFGQPVAAGDHFYGPSAFATKLFAAGVALVGYQGMDRPAANSGAVGQAGGLSPVDPDVSFLDAGALSATPQVYLIPVGVDSMRSPPLGDRSTVRSWTVDDVSVPMPFNLGASEFSTGQPWQSGSTLSEPLYAIRKHQAFRPVPSADFFAREIYTAGGGLQRSQYTNNRLIGRSVWNSQWKLVIPATYLLNDPQEGLDRFLRSVRDIQLNFVTYSYSGN